MTLLPPDEIVCSCSGLLNAGIADAYIEGDFACMDLLAFIRLLIVNQDAAIKQNKGRFNFEARSNAYQLS